jgi:putative phosphoribosyl transferase
MRRRSALPGVRFHDRHDAGKKLGAALADVRGERPIVVGLPRGGVVVAYEVALSLDAPLDVVIVRKLGAPFRPEYAIGAIGEDGVVVVDDAVVDAYGLRGAALDRIVEQERAELDRRSQRFRAGVAPMPVAGRTVLLVDDGVATGSTARAAAHVLRRRGAARIVLAVPVGPPDVGDRFAVDVDEVVCLQQPRDLFAVGQAYDEFGQTSDEEVEALLRAATARDVDAGPGAGGVDRAR